VAAQDVQAAAGESPRRLLAGETLLTRAQASKNLIGRKSGGGSQIERVRSVRRGSERSSSPYSSPAHPGTLASRA